MTDFTYVRSWAGRAYVAFILDVFSQRIVAWHAATTKETDLVMTALRMALWKRDREGHRVSAGQLIHHSDAGSLGGFNRSLQHLVTLGVCGGATSGGCGSGGVVEAGVAGALGFWAGGRAGVLAEGG